MARHGGDTVSRIVNRKLTKLYWPSRKRSPKRLMVLLRAEKVEGHDQRKTVSAVCARPVPPTFKFVLAPLVLSINLFLLLCVGGTCGPEISERLWGTSTRRWRFSTRTSAWLPIAANWWECLPAEQIPAWMCHPTESQFVVLRRWCNLLRQSLRFVCNFASGKVSIIMTNVVCGCSLRQLCWGDGFMGSVAMTT